MKHLMAALTALLAALCASGAAHADSASLLSQASAANAPRYQFATTLGAQIQATSDNLAFSVWWAPAGWTPQSGVIVTLHGHGSYAFDEFYLWQPYAAAKGYAVLALQWWFGGGEATSDYYTPQAMYPILAGLLANKSVSTGTALLHGFSRGSANSYAVAAQDAQSGNRYFHMVLSVAGGAMSNYPPNQQIAAGNYGSQPFAGYQWVMYCGEKDPDPGINGCPAMTAARDWVVKYGATFSLLIDDPSGDHGGFMTNSANVNTALAQFTPTPPTPASISDCLFNWAEAHYSQYFAPHVGTSGTYQQYYYRYYPAKGNYVAVSSADNHVWVLGPLSGNAVTDVGTVSSYQGQAGCTR